MKRLKRIISLTLITVFLNSQVAYAKIGDMGFFGGISEGTKLPKSTEILLNQTKNTKNKKNETAELVYKEVVFLSGVPTEVEGILTVKSSGTISDTDKVGTYKETYTVQSNGAAGDDANIDRSIVFVVNYRKEGNQIIKDYEMESWSETIGGGDSLTLDETQSHYGVSIIEDHTPGVTYYRGDISQRGVYTSGQGADANEPATILDVSGSFYGYTSAWSSTETHRIDGTVTTPQWQMQYQVRPSVSVSKTLQYTKNEPTAISFEGNYKEVMQNLSGLEYDIFVKPNQFYNEPNKGNVNIATYNTFEQLIAPDINYLKGHNAEYDIKKLFSMQVLEGDPKFYQPNQAITRGQYTTALVKAIKLPIAQEATTTKKKSSKKQEPIEVIFPDVTSERQDYPYIMAAFENNLAIGRGEGNFNSDDPMERQEAITILIRTLGLENLGLDPTPMTSFTDDAEVASWAKKELYAAQRLGIISGDDDGNIRPTEFVSKAEAAALLNRLIDYMRSDLATDYAEHVVNYAK